MALTRCQQRCHRCPCPPQLLKHPPRAAAKTAPRPLPRESRKTWPGAGDGASSPGDRKVTPGAQRRLRGEAEPHSRARGICRAGILSPGDSSGQVSPAPSTAPGPPCPLSHLPVPSHTSLSLPFSVPKPWDTPGVSPGNIFPSLSQSQPHQDCLQPPGWDGDPQASPSMSHLLLTELCHSHHFGERFGVGLQRD